jgi:hypothetical protein
MAGRARLIPDISVKLAIRSCNQYLRERRD